MGPVQIILTPLFPLFCLSSFYSHPRSSRFPVLLASFIFIPLKNHTLRQYATIRNIPLFPQKASPLFVVSVCQLMVSQSSSYSLFAKFRLLYFPACSFLLLPWICHTYHLLSHCCFNIPTYLPTHLSSLPCLRIFSVFDCLFCYRSLSWFPRFTLPLRTIDFTVSSRLSILPSRATVSPSFLIPRLSFYSSSF
jgi:hypothetical protein